MILLLPGYYYYLVMDASTGSLPFPMFHQVRVLQQIETAIARLLSTLAY